MLSIEDIRRKSGDYDLNNVTHLLFNRRQLQSVASLLTCRELVWLDISDNQIIDVSPLSRLVKLEILVANNNKIRSLNPLKGHQTLKDVRVCGNEFQSIEKLVHDCASLKRLERFDLFPLECEESIGLDSPFDLRCTNLIADAEIRRFETDLLAACPDMTILNGS